MRRWLHPGGTRPPAIVLVILTVAAISHLALFVFALMSPEAPLQFDRAAARLSAARRFAAAETWTQLSHVLTREAPPGDFAWHGLVLRLFHGWVPALQLAQLALAVLSLVCVYRMARDLGLPPRGAWLALIFYACIPIDFMIPHFVASEAFFNPLLVIGTWFLLRFATRSQRWRDLGLGGIFYSLAAMTRPELLPWLPVLLLLAWLVLHRMDSKRLWMRFGLFLVAVISLPCLWLLSRPAAGESLDFGHGELSIRAEMARRAAVIESAATGSTVSPQPGGISILQFLQVAGAHPREFGRNFGLHVIKFLALPDNLDFFRYVGAFEMTGKRAELVHQVGWMGALRVLWKEMPLLTSCLLASMAVFACFQALVFWGIVSSLRRSPPLRRLLLLLIVSLPLVYVGLRAVTQGESRKRSAVDYTLVLFAAAAVEDLLRRRREHRALGGPEPGGRGAGDASPAALPGAGRDRQAPNGLQ